MPKHTIPVECSACNGTGVYSGFAEKPGVAVVCNNCDGTGKAFISYNSFKGKKRRKGVIIVFQKNLGRVLGPQSLGGLSYKDWYEEKPFPKFEDRENYCPAWWFQCMDYNKKPNWHECIGAGSFSDCKMYCRKSECWKKFDTHGPKEKK